MTFEDLELLVMEKLKRNELSSLEAELKCALDASRKLLAAERKAREEAEARVHRLEGGDAIGPYPPTLKKIMAKKEIGVVRAERDAARREAEEAEEHIASLKSEMGAMTDTYDKQAERLSERHEALREAATVAWRAWTGHGNRHKGDDMVKAMHTLAQALAPESGEEQCVQVGGGHPEEWGGTPSPSPEAGECRFCGEGPIETDTCEACFDRPAASEEGSDGPV